MSQQKAKARLLSRLSRQFGYTAPALALVVSGLAVQAHADESTDSMMNAQQAPTMHEDSMPDAQEAPMMHEDSMSDAQEAPMMQEEGEEPGMDMHMEGEAESGAKAG